MSARIAISSAKGILLTCNKTMLEEYGGPVVLGISWAHSLLKRMGFVQRKASTALSKCNGDDLESLKKGF